MKSYLVIFIGGGLGANLRYVISLLVRGLSLKPWVATLAANLIGCFLYFMFERYLDILKSHNEFVRIGILGSLTTFSAFSYEVVMSYKSGKIEEAGMILFLNIFFGILIGIGILR